MAIASPPRPPTENESDALVREARARQRRRRLTGAAAVTLLAGAALVSYAVAGRTAAHPGGLTPSGARPVSASACRASQLRTSLVHTGSDLGVEGGLLRVTNLSRTACLLAGWPTVTAVEANGTTITSHHAVNGTMLFGWDGLPGKSPPKIRLQHQSSAYAILANGDNPVGTNPRSCPTARRLVVSPPKIRAKTSLSAWLPNDGVWLPLCADAHRRPELAVSPLLRLSAILR
jgi:hypothetical protein